MNLRRLLCRIWRHDPGDLTPERCHTVGGCHRCGDVVLIRRGYRTRVIR